MSAYHEVYLNEVVETQGKLFDYVAHEFQDSDTEDFIRAYMSSNTRRYIDECQAYVNTKSATELWDYFQEIDGYHLKKGEAMRGFMPDWIGEFYAYYQWYYDISSRELVQKISVDFLRKAYWGLHDLDIELAVRKVGAV